MKSKESHIWVFVYGTLRAGDDDTAWNNRMLADACVDDVRHCTTSGRVYFVHDRVGYPVAKFDEDGTIIGDLLQVAERSDGFKRVHRMEIGAGYEGWTVQVTKPDGTTVDALAYHYRHRPQGERIESGDWLSEVTRGR